MLGSAIPSCSPGDNGVRQRKTGCTGDMHGRFTEHDAIAHEYGRTRNRRWEQKEAS